MGMAGAQGIKQFTIIWLVLDLTGSVAQLGLVVLVQGFPMTVISLYGGVIADRYDRRMVLALSQLVGLVTIFLLAMLTLFGVVELWHVYATSLLLGVTQALSAPARQALIAGLVVPEERMNAVALNSVQQHASRILWPSLAGLLITWFGVGPALLANAGCHVLAIAPLLLMRGVRQDLSRHRLSPIKEVIEGIKYTKSTPVVSLVIGITLAFGMFTLAFVQMAPGFARAGLGFNAAEAGLFMLSIGVGALAGGVLLTTLNIKSTATHYVAATMGMALILVLFAVNPWYPVIFVLAALFGMSNSAQVIVPNAIFQVLVPSQFLGRVVSLWFLAAGIAAISAFPIGLVGEAYGLRTAFGLSGSIYIVIAFWFGLVRPRLRARKQTEVLTS